MNSHLGAQEKSPNLDLLPSPCQSQHLNSLQHNYGNYRQKLIEVSLPLEAINKESAREKSIRHGHRRCICGGCGDLWQLVGHSCLHLWWTLPQSLCQYLAWDSIVRDKEALNLDVFQSNQATTKQQQTDKDVKNLVVLNK